jgi:hypothetical protein
MKNLQKKSRTILARAGLPQATRHREQKIRRKFFLIIFIFFLDKKS